MTRSEAARLLHAAMSEPKVRLYLPLFILIGLYTGARKEAILQLRWSQVDLTGNRIDFNPVGRRHTNKRRARTPISASLLPHLNRMKRLFGSDTGHVINRHGRPLKNIKKGFAAACSRAGIEGVTPHVLRHTCATWLMQSGVDKWEAAGFLAMSMETLEKNYAHHHPDYLQGAANAL